MKPFEIMTHKTGKFVFSGEHDPLEIKPRLVEATTLYQAVRELPILPAIEARLRADIIRRSIFGTAAIEGNKLSEEEVQGILDKDKKAVFDNRAEIEIYNLKRLYSHLNGKKSERPWRIREKYIKDVHCVLTRRIDYYHNSPGKYRNEPVFVGNIEHGGVYKPPKTLSDINNLMKVFVDWINSEQMCSLDPIIRACLAHFHLAKIHPFQDGNGRSARFVEAMTLDRAGIKYLPQMMSNYYYRNIDDYFIAFSNTHKCKNGLDVTPFLTFCLDGMISSIKEIKTSVVFSIRDLSLRDFYYFQRKEKNITKRQLEFLLVLLDTALEFSKSDLFVHPVLRPIYKNISKSTARRDLIKLNDEGYLQHNEEKDLFRVNFYMLG